MTSYEELHHQREKRVNDVIQLKVPDRVPIMGMFGHFYTKYARTTCDELTYNKKKLYDLGKKVILEYQPDLYANPMTYVVPGTLLDALDFKQLRWPACGTGSNTPFQFVENEYLKADEYDDFLKDPSDWILRCYLPRTCGVLQPFEHLVPLRHLTGYHSIIPYISVLHKPEIRQALESLLIAARESHEMLSQAQEFHREMTSLGFPLQFGAITFAPFDALGDTLRGTKGIMLDMYRRPEKILEACEKMEPILIEAAASAAQASGVPRAFIPLHKGAEGFMSQDQFRKFYWPGLRSIMLKLIDKGITPFAFMEGGYTSRLEIISDMPAGKAVYHFEDTDLFKAKEVLGDHICLRGNVPLALFSTGTPDQVKEYCRKLIDVVGKNGGFIMDSSGELDDARPENVKAMFEFTREYGVYR